VLAPRRPDQAIDGVIDIVVVGRDNLVAEIDRLLGAVGDGGDVASRVIGVVQVLQDGLVG
jgi:hypothetical protein